MQFVQHGELDGGGGSLAGGERVERAAGGAAAYGSAVLEQLPAALPRAGDHGERQALCRNSSSSSSSGGQPSTSSQQQQQHPPPPSASAPHTRRSGRPAQHTQPRWQDVQASESSWRSAPTLAQDRAVQCLVMVSQALVVLTQGGKAQGTLLVRLQPAAVLAVLALGLLIITRWPKMYWANRTWVLTLIRLSVCVVPSTRQVGVGTALVLERAPHPGLRGAVTDLLRMTVGIRILPLLLHSAFMPLPPTASLVTHVGLTALTWNSEGYCTTRLLSHPLAVVRQHLAATALEWAALPLGAVQPLATLLAPAKGVLAAQVPPEALCRATVSVLHICLGLLVPLVLAVYNWQPPPQQAEHAQAEHAAQQPRPAATTTTWSWKAAVCSLVAHTDRVVHTALDGSASPVGRCIILWYILENCWLLSKLGAGF